MKLNLPKSSGALKAAALLLALILVLQVAILGYFNLFHLKDHMGFDSSWNYLKTTLIWNEKTISGTGLWIDTSNAQLDCPAFPAVLLYGLTGNVFLASGITNMIILVLLLWALWALLTRLNLSLCAKLVALNLLVCPYLTEGFYPINDLSYMGNMLVGASYYSIRALLALLILTELIRFHQEDRFRPLCVVSLLLCGLCGLSSGVFMFIVLLAPCLLYELLLSFLKSDWKQLVKKESLFLYACCAALLFGRFLARHVFGIVANDISRTWTTIERLWTNIGAVFQGFLKLTGTLPLNSEITILTPQGLYMVVPLFLTLVFILGVGFAIKKTRKDLHSENGVPLLLLTILLATVIIFSLFNVQYGMAIFEERYLIIAFLVLIILVACLVDRLKPKSPFAFFILAGLILSLAVADVHSDKLYQDNTNESWQMDEIVETAKENNAQLAYCWGQDVWTLGLALRVYDMDRVYKDVYADGAFHHWGDYLLMEHNSDYSGPTLLIVSEPQIDDIPEEIFSQYDLVQVLDNVHIFACDHNPHGL